MTETPKPPAPSPPATEDEIDSHLGWETLEYRRGFYAGVRWAENLHHITEKENKNA